MYDHRITHINTYAGGPFQQALSGLTNLNNDWYDGKAYQKYAFEYEPGAEGYVTWYVGEDKTWTLDGRSLRANGNIGQRPIPEEPMTVIANFGMSNSFSALNLTGLAKLMPATMRIDYIRIYQDEDNQIMTCDPEGFPTTDYIRKHPEPYKNPNLTLWYVLLRITRRTRKLTNTQGEHRLRLAQEFLRRRLQSVGPRTTTFDTRPGHLSANHFTYLIM